MKYFVYFDAYGHAREIISEQDLTEKFAGEPDEFLAAMCRRLSGAPDSSTSGHVGTLSFDSQMELQQYLESLGDEITGFYGCRSESRPYNF